ncbi:hypothetical protein FACS189413_06110 [Bacteroidia bacterium]|nr:hypothetical protein FACS189413_06110 [Bacteroidia bacterium]
MAQPAVSAPVPAHPASDVISVFSDSYTAATGFQPQNWTSCVATVETIGNNDKVVKLPALGDSPVFISTWKINTKSMIHIDVYYESGGNGSFRFGFDGSWQGNAKYPVDYTWTSTKQGEWVSMDIPTALFADAGVDMYAITTVRFVGSGTFYIDNFYAYGEKSTAVTPAPTPDTDPSKVIPLYSEHYNSTYKFDGKYYGETQYTQWEEVELAPGDKAMHLTNLNYMPFAITPAWNISGMKYIHLHVFLKTDVNAAVKPASLGVGLDNNGGAQAVAGNWGKLKTGEWVDVKVRISDFIAGGINVESANVMRVQGGGYPSLEVYIDNVYAFIDDDIDNAPDIYLPTGNIIPIYTNGFTGLTSINSAAESGYEVVDLLGEDKAIKLTDLDTQTMTFYPTLNLESNSYVSGAMEYLHLDAYLGTTENVALQIGLQPVGSTTTYYSTVQTSLANKTWVPVNIPLAELKNQGVNIANLLSISIKAVGNTTSTVYIDNIYAYKGTYYSTARPKPEFTDGKTPAAVPTNFNQPFLGVNLSSASGGANPGVLGTNYRYPTSDDLYYFKEKGVRLIRLPFRWSRIQHELNGPLDAEQDLAELKRVVTEAERIGVLVMLDMHDYCRRTVGSTTYVVGQTNNLTAAHLADAWTKLALEFKDYTNIWGYDIMNEPYGMETSLWKTVAKTTIQAIRAVDTKTAIVIEGNNYAGTHSWDSNGAPLIDLVTGNGFSDYNGDSNLIFQGHCYFDNDNSGTYKKDYETEVGSRETSFVNRLDPFINWLKANNLRGMVGEFGVPCDDWRWLRLLDKVLTKLKNNNVSATYWSAGVMYDGDPISVQPVNNYTKDKQQMVVLEKYINTFADGWSSIKEIPVSSSANIQLYPNPVIDVLNIASESSVQNVKVYNTVGQLVVNQSNTNQIDCSRLAKGHYLVKITLNNNTSITKKIIK